MPLSGHRTINPRTMIRSRPMGEPDMASALFDSRRAAAEDLFEQASENLAGVEEFRRNLSSGGGVQGIVAFHFTNRRSGLLDRLKRENALAGRQHRSKAGVLHHHRSSRCQVGRGTVAEP